MKPTKITNIKGDVLIASYGTCSTGFSVTGINNIIFASPTKSMVRVLQSLGRGLRLHEGKSVCTLYDIGDKLFDKGAANHTFKHLEERLQIYAKEQFKVNTHVVTLKP